MSQALVPWGAMGGRLLIGDKGKRGWRTICLQPFCVMMDFSGKIVFGRCGGGGMLGWSDVSIERQALPDVSKKPSKK